ncbi:MAG: hypothetical protein MZV63_32300 [Marinilabiliales bacterium]|nr:hypothetical protein [Marinilabiliales bacterium]
MTLRYIPLRRSRPSSSRQVMRSQRRSTVTVRKLLIRLEEEEISRHHRYHPLIQRD